MDYKPAATRYDNMKYNRGGKSWVLLPINLNALYALYGSKK